MTDRLEMEYIKHSFDEQNLGRYLQQSSRNFIDSINNVDDHLKLCNAHLAYSNLCIVYFVSSYLLLTKVVIFLLCLF